MDILPWLVIGCALVWALATVFSARVEDREQPGIITLRIGHYQLEKDVQRGLEEMAREYQKIHPNVRIIQEVIPPEGYGQWLTTQLISGKSNDILEIGGGLPAQIQLSYAARYYVPLTKYAREPNPYNKGTDLEKIELKDTYWDSMRNSFTTELQEYTSIPLAQVGIRVFYNKDLLKRATGVETPPGDYAGFFRLCQEIETKSDENYARIVPIACSTHNWSAWDANLATPLTYQLITKADFNFDGFADAFEWYLACRQGRTDLTSPEFLARLQVSAEIARYFQPGFVGANRPEAMMAFMQGRAVFMAVGSFEAKQVLEQASRSFTVGMMDFPEISTSDRTYGALSKGRPFEVAGSVFQFCVTNGGRHVPEAIDFLLFLASQKHNQQLNQITGWLPAISGAVASDELSIFRPHVTGPYPISDLTTLGAETSLKWRQMYSLLQLGRLSSQDFATQFQAFYLAAGEADFLESFRNFGRTQVATARTVTSVRAQALEHEGKEAEPLWKRYAALVSRLDVMSEYNRRTQLRIFQEKPPVSADPTPDGYSEYARQKINASIAPAAKATTRPSANK